MDYKIIGVSVPLILTPNSEKFSQVALTAFLFLLLLTGPRWKVIFLNHQILQGTDIQSLLATF